MNYRECYDFGRKVLTEAGIEEADLDARLLLEFVCGTTRNDLLVHGDREVEENAEQTYRGMIGQRAARIPLQHITGVQEFMGLEFGVNENVLIPRQDTEILVEEVLRDLTDGSKVLDMCTGSGCILLSLLHYSNDCVGVGADLSEKALKVAAENARRLGIAAASAAACGENGQTAEVRSADARASVRFIHSDLFENPQIMQDGRFDVIVSNPPYIATAEIETLMDEVRLHEPMMALDGSRDGLLFYRKIVEAAPEYLVRGGGLYFEIGYDQGEAVSSLMTQAGFHDVKVVKDYAGLDRVVRGVWY